MFRNLFSQTNLGVFALLLFAFSSMAQQEVPFDCHADMNIQDFAKSPPSGGNGGPGCFDQMTVEDISHMPIITMKVDFHFVKSNNHNFQCTDPSALYYAPTYVNQILGYANFLSTDPAQNQFGTSPDLIDSRIRYQLIGNPPNPCDAIFIHDTYPTSYANPDAFHIIVLDNGQMNVGGSTNSSTYMELNNIHYFIFEQGWVDAAVWGNVVHHEFGHVFGLCHAFSAQNTIADMNPSQECGGPSATMCGSNPCPPIPPGTPHPDCGTNTCYRCYCTWGTGNNFMGYTLPQIGMTRLQWAQMYGTAFTTQPNFVSIERSCAVSSSDPIVIPAGQFVEWNNFRILDRPLIVETGATLIIRCEVWVSQELTILVKHGAKLFVEGGKITSGSPSCLWGGIYVLGDATHAQPLAADAQNYFFNIPADGAGVVWINGGTIENAVCGISTKGFGDTDSQLNYGGLVMVNSSDFINNGRAVEFMKYNFSNKSYFKDVDIKRSGTPNWLVNRGVSIWACSDVKFEDVRFEGISEYDIYGINFTAQVKHCSFKNVVGNNFIQQYGFRSENTAPNIQPLSSTIIEDSDFELIKQDIYSNSTPGNIYPMTIKGNRFKKKPTSGLFGIRIIGESFYNIGSANEFNNKLFGIYLSGTGPLANSINCNFFGASELVNTGINANGANTGLEILGNEFMQNTNTEIFVASGASIHETQGKQIADADNCFFNPVNAVRVNSAATPFKYFVFNLNNNPEICEKPTNNLSDGGTNNYSLSNSTIKRTACDYNRPPVTPSDLPPARQNTALKKAIWQADPLNEQKFINYVDAKDWQAYVLRYVLQQSVKVGDLASAETYLLGENTNQARREVVGLRFSQGNISGASTLVNTMTIESPEDLRFRDIMNINFAIAQSVDPVHYQLSSSQYNQLMAIVNEPTSIMRGYACALLSFCTGYACEENPPTEFEGSENREETALKEAFEPVSVFPNPNSGNWSIQCPTHIQEDLTYQILTIDGKLVKSQKFVNTGDYKIHEESLPDGLYMLRLTHKDNIVYQGRIVVIH